MGVSAGGWGTFLQHLNILPQNEPFMKESSRTSYNWFSGAARDFYMYVQGCVYTEKHPQLSLLRSCAKHTAATGMLCVVRGSIQMLFTGFSILN